MQLFLFSNLLGATEALNVEGAIENVPPVLLMFIVDPVSGEFKKKAYVSQTYNKKLIISGLNLAAVQDKRVSVNFKFLESPSKENINIPATIEVPGSGIANRAGVKMLILDMKEEPFGEMSLAYDMCRPKRYPCLITSVIELVISNDATGEEEQRISSGEMKLVVIPEYE